jgi:signal transduction histidine kinase
VVSHRPTRWRTAHLPLPTGGDHVPVGGVRAAAALAQENKRLGAKLRAQVDELRASRARLVEAGLAERRRLERDLHDGAQQRLVSLALGLRTIEERLDEDPSSARGILEMVCSELEAALRELRELARGIHPAVLSDRGLDAALEALARRAPLPVELETTIGERLPEPVELAVYFVVSEALTNVAKHAHASQASVRAARHNGRVVVEVSDDGVGGAGPAQGSGLSGLADRLLALDGKLEVASERGQGTVLRAEIPC